MKYNKILAVGVTGALLFSITGSVQPLNQANAQINDASGEVKEKDKGELDKAKENALVELGKLANLTDEEKAGFQEKISAADSKEAADKVVEQAKAKDTEELNKAKAKAATEMGGLNNNLSRGEVARYRAEISLADSKEKVNYVLAKAKAVAEINKLANLNDLEKEGFKVQIPIAGSSIEEVDKVVDKAKEQDRVNKELKDTKTKASAEIEKLALDLDGKQIEDFKSEINNASSIEKVNYVLAKANALAEIYKLANNSDEEEIKNFEDEINNDANSIEKVNYILAKAKAVVEINKLDNLSKEEKESAKAEIYKASSVEEVHTALAKAKALAEIDKLANLNEEEKAGFREKISAIKFPVAGDIEEVNKVLKQAKEKDKANKEAKDKKELANAKEKALADLAKFDNLSKDEKESFKEEINKANSIDEVQTVSAKAQLKNVTKTAEAKDTALEELDKLANLTDEQKNNLKAKIYSANSVAEVNTALDQAIAKNTANKEAKEKKELANAKTKAKAEIDKLDDVSKEDKDNLKAVIDKINSIEEFNKFFNKVKEKAKEDIDKYDNLSKEEKGNLKAEIDKITNSIEGIDKVFGKVKEKAKEDIDKFDNLSKEEKDNLKSEIVKAKNAKEFNDTLAKAKAKNNANKEAKEKKELANAKAKALAEIDKLDDISKEDKDKLKDLIDKINSIDGFNKFFDEGKEKLKAEIDKFDDLSKEEKDNLKAEIDKTTNSIEAIDKVFDKIKEKLKAVIDKLDNLSKEEKESAKAEIYKANNAKEVNDALAKAKEKNTANKEAKENTIYKIGYLDNLTKEQKESLIAEVNSKKAKDEIEKIYQKAKELDKKQRKDVTPNPSLTPYVTPTPETEAGWLKDEIGWSYQRANGSIAKAEWEMINGTWYHFDSKGYMQTGWLNLDGTWYYLNADGKMATDTYVDGYYVDANGAWVVEGWQNSGYGWWYQRANGSYPSNGWEMINGIWYYFDANGYMLANTTTPDGYYVDENGAWVK